MMPEGVTRTPFDLWGPPQGFHGWPIAKVQLGQLSPGNSAFPGFGKGDSRYGEGDSRFGEGDSGFCEGDSGFGEGGAGFCGESLAAG